MKRMMIVLLLLTGLAVCGLLILRHSRRVPIAPATPASPHSGPDARDLRAVDAWQSAIKLDANSTYTPDAAAKQRLIDLGLETKLRKEEEKQRPQEGRN